MKCIICDKEAKWKMLNKKYIDIVPSPLCPKCASEQFDKLGLSDSSVKDLFEYIPGGTYVSGTKVTLRADGSVLQEKIK